MGGSGVASSPRPLGTIGALPSSRVASAVALCCLMAYRGPTGCSVDPWSGTHETPSQNCMCTCTATECKCEFIPNWAVNVEHLGFKF